MKLRKNLERLTKFKTQSGFSLIEMMIVVLVITIIMGAVFKSINVTQQTSTQQQMRLDLTQQARNFVDQITTDEPIRLEELFAEIGRLP